LCLSAQTPLAFEAASVKPAPGFRIDLFDAVLDKREKSRQGTDEF
jgi:hypothetical protein